MDLTVGEVATVPVWSRIFVAALEQKPGLFLISRVANSASFVDQKVPLGILRGDIRYSTLPFFAFEAKSALGASYGAANRLSISLSDALGRIRQLRTDARGQLY